MTVMVACSIVGSRGHRSGGTFVNSFVAVNGLVTAIKLSFLLK
jgi:hypothetical protein